MRAARGQSRWCAVLIALSAATPGCGLLHKAADVADDPGADDDATDDDAALADGDYTFSDAAVADADPAVDSAEDAADIKDIKHLDAAPDVAKAADAAVDVAHDAAADVPPDTGPAVCTPAEVSACSDDNVCTTDSCDPQKGCSHKAFTGSCDDGSVCTTDDSCASGQCAGTAISCDDGKACTVDSCKPAFGCVHQNGGAACDDGNVCTTGESCKAGVCIGGSPADCSDGIACTLDTCAPGIGCQHSTGDGPCDDGSYCTIGEQCIGGACGGGSPALCDDGNDCTSNGCDPPTGCTFTAQEGSCDDGNPCAVAGVCVTGACVDTPVFCPPADVCHAAGVCNPKTGVCSVVNAPDGATCTDGLACTANDLCAGGACVGIVQCDDNDACTLDACLATGVCQHAPHCTVGGTVSGLLGSGLTLQSGSHSATVSQNGSFVLAGTFANGAKYFTTITAAPGAPAQTCSVSNGAGTIGGASVADVAVSCGSCGDGVVGADPVVRVEIDWLAYTNVPGGFMDCAVNGVQLAHVPVQLADPAVFPPLTHREKLTGSQALAAIAAGPNAFSCQTPQQVAWVVATVWQASGRGGQVVLFDAPGDSGGATDGLRRNDAFPGYAVPAAAMTATLQVQLQEACDDGNLDEGDGCSSLCQPEACVPGTDSDSDGLDDCYETGTGVYVDATHTGTSPVLWDTDGDALSDGDELLGTAGGLDLAALGANPLRQDVFVEADWMVDAAECAQHSHKLTAPQVALADAMYAAAPVLNPDGSTGVALHVDYGQGGVWTGGNQAGTTVQLPLAIGTEFAAVKAANFAANRLGYFHYAILIHSIGPDAGGLGELIGDDYIVASGGCDVCYVCKGTTNPGHVQLEAFCHELGHNLGLGHGGDSECNGKPNYPSIMNYRHAYFGIDSSCDDIPDGTLDYSRGGRTPLNEAALNEADGVCGGAWVDWNQDGEVTLTLAQDLNAEYDPTCPGGALSAYTDYNDWAAITFAGIFSFTDAYNGGGHKIAQCYDDPASIAKRQPVRWLAP